MAIRRDTTVYLSLDEGINIIDVINDAGIIPLEHLRQVQPLYNNQYDVSFASVVVKRKFMSTLVRTSGVTASAYSEDVKLVTVIHIPFEVNDSVVRYVLGRYGEVIRGRMLTMKEFPTVFNGTRQYQVRLREDIPSTLRFGGRNCLVRYFGQPRTCLRCGEVGHVVKDCSSVKCFKCHQLGHVARDCDQQLVCNTCGKTGHGYNFCPVSFAGKVKQSSAWSKGGAVVAADEKGEVVETVEESDGEDMVSVSSQPEKVNGGEPEPIDFQDVEAHAPGPVEEGITEGEFTKSQTSIFDIEGLTVIPDREVNSQTRLFDGETEEVIVGEKSLDSWADLAEPPDTPVEVTVPKHTRAESEADAEGRDKQEWKLVDRKSRDRQKTTPPPTPAPRMDRSRSGIRGNTKAKAQDCVKKSNITTMKKEWFSCLEEGCCLSFTEFKTFLVHVAENHPHLHVERVPCPLKWCKVETKNPIEWANHLAAKHSNYVLSNGVEFLNNFFLKNL